MTDKLNINLIILTTILANSRNQKNDENSKDDGIFLNKPSPLNYFQYATQYVFSAFYNDNFFENFPNFNNDTSSVIIDNNNLFNIDNLSDIGEDDSVHYFNDSLWNIDFGENSDDELLNIEQNDEDSVVSGSSSVDSGIHAVNLFGNSQSGDSMVSGNTSYESYEFFPNV